MVFVGYIDTNMEREDGLAHLSRGVGSPEDRQDQLTIVTIEPAVYRKQEGDFLQ